MKTISLKKVSAVAVASLGFGILSVVPAQAAVSAAAIADVSDVGNIGDTVTSAMTFTTTVANETATLTLSVPSGSALSLTNGDGAGTDVYADNDGGDTTFNATTGVITEADGDGGAGDISLTPDIAGTYTFTLKAGTSTDTYKIYAADLYGSTADGLTNGDQSNVAISAVAGAFNNVTLTVRTVVGQRLVAVTGGTINAFTTGATSTGTIATDKTTMVVTDAAVAEDATFTVATPSVGTITVKLYDTAQGGIFKTAASGQVVITVNVAAQTGAVDAALTTAVLSNTGAADATLAIVNTAATTLTAPATQSLQQGEVAVDITTVAGALSATTVKTATITGPGVIQFLNNGDTAGNSTGRSLISIGNDADYEVGIFGDGTTGTATVTVTAGTFTKSITVVFYGTAKTLTATQALTHASTAGDVLGDTASATTAAATVKVVDATGNPVVGVTPTVVSATTTVIASGACSASSSTGVSFCSVTSAANTAGKTASVTFKTTVSGVDIVSNALTFTLGGALSKFSWAFDKASYTAGSKMTITITGVDATGAATFDGSKDIFTSVTPSAASSYLQTTDIAGVDFVGGKATITMFAPLSAGPFSVVGGIEAGFQTAMGGASATVATTVTDGNAALLTQIDALNAKIVALNALIAKIMKKLGVK